MISWPVNHDWALMFTKVVQIFNETYYFIVFCLFIEVRESERWISPSGNNEKNV